MHHSTAAFFIFVVTINTLTSKRVTAQPLFLFLILLGKAKRAEKTYASTGASKLNASKKEKEINTQRKIVVLFGTALTQKEYFQNSKHPWFSCLYSNQTTQNCPKQDSHGIYTLHEKTDLNRFATEVNMMQI